MKALLITTMIIAGSLVASTGYSQVYIGARVRIGIPAARVYCAPAPAPVVYEDGYAPAPLVIGASWGDEAYYNYPAWNGHYRDRFYFDHYRPFYERDRARFDRGFRDHGRDFGRGNDRHFDHYRR